MILVRQIKQYHPSRASHSRVTRHFKPNEISSTKWNETNCNKLQRNRLQLTSSFRFSSFRCSSCAGQFVYVHWLATPFRVSSRQISFLSMFGISCSSLQQLDLVDIDSANEREVGRLRHHFWMLAIYMTEKLVPYSQSQSQMLFTIHESLANVYAAAESWTSLWAKPSFSSTDCLVR